ncbi:MAG: hypothetical protein IT317_05445 [Anaerolineales bacterium]|nr:hypothetical protein [Anaerolineales bacterium]
MPRLLIAYASLAGATAEVAREIAEELSRAGFTAEVRAVADVDRLDGYAGVVLGGPMILGWHRAALGFLRRHRAALQKLPLAVFVLAMRLTQPADTMVGGLPVLVDEHLPTPPAVPGRLSLKERYAQLGNYVRPILAAVRPAKPAALALFGGRMEYGRLPWWAVIFAMAVIQAPAGDRRNRPVIRAWAASLPAAMRLAPAPHAEAHALAG